MATGQDILAVTQQFIDARRNLRRTREYLQAVEQTSWRVGIFETDFLVVASAARDYASALDEFVIRRYALLLLLDEG